MPSQNAKRTNLERLEIIVERSGVVPESASNRVPAFIGCTGRVESRFSLQAEIVEIEMSALYARHGQDAIEAPESFIGIGFIVEDATVGLVV